MKPPMYVADYAGNPDKLLAALAELAGRSGNERLRRVYERMKQGKHCKL